jgi:hypothetical protein
VDSTSFLKHRTAFTPCNLTRASQVPGMRAQTFHANCEKFDRFNYEVSCGFPYSTCMKRLLSHAQHLTRASQLESCKRCFVLGRKVRTVLLPPILSCLPSRTATCLHSSSFLKTVATNGLSTRNTNEIFSHRMSVSVINQTISLINTILFHLCTLTSLSVCQ